MAFGIPLVLLLYYALRGGSYDIVTRQQEALVIWWVIGIGFAVGVLPRARPHRSVLVPLALVAVLAVWTALSLGWSESEEHTFAELARVLHYLGLLVLVWSAVDERTWRQAAGGVVTAALVVAILSVASRLFPGPFPADDLGRVFGLSRLNYPFDYWNAVAAWSAMSLALGLGWSAHGKTLAGRALALAALPACGLAIYLTYSRAGVVGAALGLVAVLAFSRNRFVVLVHALAAAAGIALAIVVTRGEPSIAKSVGHEGSGSGSVIAALLAGAAICVIAVIGTWLARGDRRWRLAPRTAAIALGVGLTVLVAVGVVFGPAAASDGWDQFRQKGDVTPDVRADPATRLNKLGGERYPIYTAAVDAFQLKPGDGIGAGSFEFWWSRRQRTRTFAVDAHSLYLENLAELGLPGGVLVAGFVLSLLVLGILAIRRRAKPKRRGDETAAQSAGLRGAFVAAFLVFAVHAGVDWIWESTAATVLALVAVAVAIAARSTPAVRPRFLLRLPVVLLAVIAALVQLPGLVAVSKTRDSQTAFRQKSIERATAAALDAISAEPWAASPHVQAALVFEARNDLDTAARQMRMAIRHEPTNWRHPLILARVEAERGRPKAALSAYRRARRLRPHSRFLRVPPNGGG